MNQTSNSSVIGAKQQRTAVVTTTKSVAPTETFLECDSTGGAFTITMPYSFECAQGQLYLIRLIVDGGDLTVNFKAQDTGDLTSIVITIAGGYLVLAAFPNGWTNVASVLT